MGWSKIWQDITSRLSWKFFVSIGPNIHMHRHRYWYILYNIHIQYMDIYIDIHTQILMCIHCVYIVYTHNYTYIYICSTYICSTIYIYIYISDFNNTNIFTHQVPVIVFFSWEHHLTRGLPVDSGSPEENLKILDRGAGIIPITIINYV